MTTTETNDGARSEQALTTLEANLSRIEELTQRLLVAMNPKPMRPRKTAVLPMNCGTPIPTSTLSNSNI